MRRALCLCVLAIAGCGEKAEPAAKQEQPWVAYRSTPFAYTIMHPDGWHVATRSQTPGLTDPHEILSLASYPLRTGEHGNCNHIPVQALKDVPDDGVFISLQERRGSGGFTERPRPYILDPPGTASFEECAARGDLEVRWGGFRDAGRGTHVLVALGPKAAQHRETARRVIDSLRFEPPYRKNGIRFQPPSGWAVHEKQLTATVEPLQQLAFGSYEVPDRKRDPNCTPKAAIDALPRDGAFVFMFEYRRLNRTQRMRFPAYPRFRLLGKEKRAYECFGESWLFRWRDKGRTFQAHAYLGENAERRRREELLAALRSIVVTRR